MAAENPRDIWNAAVDRIMHNGRAYRLSDLARYMDDEAREEVHGQLDADSPQAFWERYVSLFPDDAEHVASITPPLPSLDEAE